MANRIGKRTKTNLAVLRREPAMAALTEQQRLFVEALIVGKNSQQAVEYANYDKTVHPSQVMASEAVQKAIQAACNAQLRGELRVKALQTMEALLGEKTPAATRFQAAKFVLEQGQAGGAGDEKPLSEMTEDELMAVIERAQATVAEAHKPRIIDITPDNGA
jgi:phage terminase small subunit